MKKKQINLRTITFITLLSSLALRSFGQGLVINEAVSSNNDGLRDEDGDASDWVEVYNTSADTLDLSGYYLSDDDDQLQMWQFPDTVLAPARFLVVFASGKNRSVAGEELHTSFSIKASGEAIYLSNDGDLEQELPVPSMEENTSYAAIPDGAGYFVVRDEPTPGSGNADTSDWDEVTFSTPGGIYDGAFEVRLSNIVAGNEIRFTTNGATPSATSALYTSALMLDTSLCSRSNISSILNPGVSGVPRGIVIRAAAFDTSGTMVGGVSTSSYFTRSLGIDHGDLPIISVSADSLSLFDNDTGIFVPGAHWDENNPYWTGNYYMTGDAWERDVHVEFYVPGGNAGFSQDAGLRTHGGNVRRNPQKGLKLYARSEYGSSTFPYPVFPDKQIAAYKRLVLKPFSASWTQAGMEDYLANKMVRGLNVDGVATRPAILYINGEYWGIYYLQESIDEYYVEENYGIDEDSAVVEANDDYTKLYDFIQEEDLSDSTNYTTVANWMDIDNFIDYQLFEIFIGNYDWPVNNVEYWRPLEGGKWRWIFKDGDGAMENYEKDWFEHALSTSTDIWPTNAGATLFLRKLLENDGFNEQFLSRMEQLLNSTLSYDSSKILYSGCHLSIADEIPRQSSRFSSPQDEESWADDADFIKTFLSSRPCYMNDQANATFEASLVVDACVEPEKPIEQTPDSTSFSLKAYPNLVSTGVTIVVAPVQVGTPYVITDDLGRIVLAGKLGSELFRLDLSLLSRGVYFLRVQGVSGPAELIKF